MPNFFNDNTDIRFLFDHLDLDEIARVQEHDFEDAQDPEFDYAPVDEADAIDNYRRTLEIAGDIAGNTIAPRAEEVDHEGNRLNVEAGTVTLHPHVADNIKRLGQADLMGFTLPRRFGGLNCPNLVYTMAVEIVSRADASLMNIFGLQGIAETINAFADEEIKQEYLPQFAAGDVTGAMVLTEPDAGSDLQAVRLKAIEEDGQWYLRGVKRFITNGCGEVLLVLARSEPDVSDGRGLSLYITDRNDRVKVRHLEHKLGIHGSPTCELVFDDCPARLVGQRQRGLITYVMALMNGARVGIAAQSLGIGEAAYRLARTYANSRKQFGGPIERLPAVAELVTDMKVHLEAARALTYETSRVCDLENNNNIVLEFRKPEDKDEVKRRKNLARALKRLNGMLTPMAKYYASEMSCKLADQCIQVLGGSGYMQDYPAERYLRDARITTIYEGTSQLQIVAAVRGVCSGAFETRVNELEQTNYNDGQLSELKARLAEGKQLVLDAIAFVKQQGTDYLDLAGRKLVDAAASVLIGHLLLHQAAGLTTTGATPSHGNGTDWSAELARKKQIAKRFIERDMHQVKMNCEVIHAADRTPLEHYDLIAGPVPATE